MMTTLGIVLYLVPLVICILWQIHYQDKNIGTTDMVVALCPLLNLICGITYIRITWSKFWCKAHEKTGNSIT